MSGSRIRKAKAASGNDVPGRWAGWGCEKEDQDGRRLSG